MIFRSQDGSCPLWSYEARNYGAKMQSRCPPSTRSLVRRADISRCQHAESCLWTTAGRFKRTLTRRRSVEAQSCSRGSLMMVLPLSAECQGMHLLRESQEASFQCWRPEQRSTALYTTVPQSLVTIAIGDGGGRHATPWGIPRFAYPSLGLASPEAQRKMCPGGQLRHALFRLLFRRLCLLIHMN